MKRLVATLLIALPLIAQQTTPPAPAAPREAKLPQPVEKTLENGLRVIVVPKHDLPLVAARLMVKTGAASDPRGSEGLAELTATVLTQGTTTKSAEQIARGVEALGATLVSDAQWDTTTIDLSVMSSNLPKAMEYVADVARNAIFAKDELERERAQAIDSLQAALAQPRTLAGVVASRLIFGDAPYGGNPEGTPKSLAKIGRDDLVRFHRTYFRPDNAVLVLAGDVKADAAFTLAKNLLGSWKATTMSHKGGPAEAVARDAAAPAAETAAVQPLRRIVVVDMPEAGQSAIIVGRRGIRRTDPAYFQAVVANSVLGGGYSSRLNQEIRIKRGLSYGAGSSFDPRADVGPFTARTETKHESAAEVVGIMVDEMSRLSAADVPESELTPRKAVIIGGFAQSLETTSGIVDRVSALARHDLPLSDINRFIGGVQAIDAQRVRDFAAARLAGDSHVAIVGNAGKFLEALKARYSDVEVIPVSELDIDSATLRVRKEKQ